MDNHEVEALPLVRIRGAGLSLKERRRRRLLVCFAAVLIIAVIFGAILSNARKAEDSSTSEVVDKSSKKAGALGTQTSNAKSECAATCNLIRQSRIDAFGADIIDSNELLKVVTAARDRAVSVLKEQYSEKFFSSIFEEMHGDKMVIRKAVVSANTTTELSAERFRRKLMLKLLSVKAGLLNETKTPQGCDCNKLSGSEQGNRRRVKEDVPKPKSFATFIWATGGHSSAAGHGNLYNESYTAVMERAVKDVFASAGIDFIGKNYAMGGTSSGPEIALCAEAIFGSDPDAVSWDFGMTDGSEASKLLLYNYRAALLPSRPALFGLGLGKRQFRRDSYVYFENDGLPSFVLEPGAEKNMFIGIPDTMGLSDEEIHALPSYVRNLKCDSKIESGDPYCDAEKYTTSICPQRRFRASWHPGWKAHALTGNAIALFLMEALVDAANELASKTDDPNQVLVELKEQEDVEYQRFHTSFLPLPVLTRLKSELFEEVGSTIFFKGLALCHTAHLPAETRFLGYLTESEKIGFWDYDKGISRREVDSNPPAQKDTAPMRLVFEDDARQECPVTLTVDFKDYFFTSSADGWTTLTIPNDSEAKAYRYDRTKINGIIMVCFTGCDWGRCRPGTLVANDINEGKGQLEVNGIPVKSLDKFDHCSILRGEDGLKWKPNNKGRFVLRARVSEPDSFIRISSVVIL